MMWTAKEMADAIGVDKQRVYRFLKANCINDAVRCGQVMRYSDAVFDRVKSEFSASKPHQGDTVEPHHDVASDAVIDAVLKQLEIKDQQISALQMQVAQLTTALEHTTESLRAAQALHAGTIQQQLTAESTAAVDAEEEQSDQDEESNGFRTWWKNFWGLT